MEVGGRTKRLLVLHPFYSRRANEHVDKTPKRKRFDWKLSPLPYCPTSVTPPRPLSGFLSLAMWPSCFSSPTSICYRTEVAMIAILKAPFSSPR